MQRVIAVAGDRDPDDAWRDYAELAAWSRWSPPIRRVEAAEETLRAGLAGTVWLLGPVGIRFVVTAVDAARRSWEWEVGPRPLRVRMRHEIVARPGGGCVATLAVDGPPAIVIGYPEVARIALGRLVRAN